MTPRPATRDHPLRVVRETVAGVGVLLAELPGADLPADGLPVGPLIEEVTAAERRLAELRGRLSVLAEAQHEAALVAAAGTDAWLARLSGTSRHEAGTTMWLGRMLATTYEPVRVAFARCEAWFEMHDAGDGTWSGRLVIPDFHAQLLTTALERLTAPRLLSRDRVGGELVTDGAAPESCHCSAKRGLALSELLDHLPIDRWGRPARSPRR